MASVEALRHESTADCSGVPVARPFDSSGVVARCFECGVPLCACELSYGHDCE